MNTPAYDFTDPLEGFIDGAAEASCGANPWDTATSIDPSSYATIIDPDD